jgi:hypothetical protein
MPPVVELIELTEARHEIVERFWQLFLHDLSAFRDSHPDDRGAFTRRRLEPYLLPDADRVAYLVYGPTGPIGFALVSGLTAAVRHFDRFFIVRSQRGGGRGRAAARFWRRLAGEIGNNATERRQPVPGKPHIPDDVILSFDLAT